MCIRDSPLGLNETGFRRIGPTDPNVPPTARREAWRRLDGDLVQGVVHDPLAWMLEGTAGNAGLFGSARDVGLFGQAVLCLRDPFDGPIAEVWTRRILPGQERGLGWDFKSPTGSTAGGSMSASSYGHTGFTGTSLWIDPEAGLGVALITNAVWCAPDAVAWRTFRSRFADNAMEALVRADLR